MNYKNHLSKIGLVLATLFVLSCSQEDSQVTSSKKEINHKVSVEQAKANVLDFISKLNIQTRSAFDNVSIKNVEAVLSESVIGTRSLGTNLSDTLFYVINFEDSCGFAITSADDRSHEIYALVENGNYSFNNEDTIDSGFDDFIVGMVLEEDGIRNQLIQLNTPDKDLLVDVPTTETNTPEDKYEVMQPLLHTNWG